MAKTNLKNKVVKYFDLFQKIKKQKLSGEWDKKRTDLTGSGSLGTNEYSDLFKVLDEFYAQAEAIFGSYSRLDSLTEAQIEQLNSAIDTLKIDGKDVGTAVLRANGVMGALTMTMQVLDAEEGLVESKRALLASKLAIEIKSDMLTRIDEVREDLRTLIADTNTHIDERADRVDAKQQEIFDYVSGTVLTSVTAIPDQVKALIAPEVVAALSTDSAASVLNSTLFQALHNNIDGVKADVADLKTFIGSLGLATGTDLATSAATIISSVTSKSTALSKKAVRDIKGSFGRGITRLTDAINAEHEFNKDEFKALKEALARLETGNADTQRKLDELLEKMAKAIKQGSKKVIIALLCAIIALIGVDIALDSIDIGNTTTPPAKVYVLTAEQQAALQFGGVEGFELYTFADGLTTSPASTIALSLNPRTVSNSNVDSHLGYSLEGSTITSSDGDAYDISTLEGKKAYADDLGLTYESYLKAGLPLSAVANEYINAASLDDWNPNSTWGGAMYEAYNSTGAMRKSLELVSNQEQHTDEDLEHHTDDQILTEEQKQNLANYQTFVETLQDYGYTGGDLATFLSGLSSAEGSLSGIYGEMAEKGLVSGQAKSEAEMKAELLGIEKEHHTDEDLEKHTDEDLEHHTDDQILTEEQKQKLAQYEQLLETSGKYDSLRQLLEQKYDGDASQMTDEELVEEVLKNATDSEYTAVCQKIHDAYESVFGAGSANGKDPVTCLDEMVEYINSLSASVGSISKEDAVKLCRVAGVDYDPNKTPEENYLNALAALGYDFELDNGNVDQDTPNKDYTGSQMGE